jgi:Rhodopirellula transposase DDE domain
MDKATLVLEIRRKYDALHSGMNEAVRRRWAAAEAKAMGRGGITLVSAATGMSRQTIRRGCEELERGVLLDVHRARLPGGGRKKLTQKDSKLLPDLESLVDPVTRGDPGSPLRWTCKSTLKLSDELRTRGHSISSHTVGELLHQQDYSLQSNRKTREGGKHPDRNTQFEHINTRVKSFHRRGAPVISVDAKKKELIGDFKNAGREWHPKGHPTDVRVYDFIDKKLGKAVPYGVYDVGANEGWVSVGVTHDTPTFAVASIRMWWLEMGRARYPEAKELLIVADSGGSNSARARLWKVELQHLADETGLRIAVSHLPPGTSKWNKIEHRMFCHITHNWRGRPLESREVIVNLIGSTTTEKGLRIRAALDSDEYRTGMKVSDDEMAALRMRRDKFHGEWNYTFSPKTPKYSFVE